MNLKKIYSLLTILFLLLFACVEANSQVTEENPMSKAIQLFDKGNFTEAELLFKTILDATPDDFMANYFYGASRTENNNFTTADLDALIMANQEVTPVKINYYFGVQYQARSNWERALKFYNKYKSITSLADDENQRILEKIQQCYDKINPYEKYIIAENKQEIIPVVIAATTSEENAFIESVTNKEIVSTEKKESIVESISNNEIAENLENEKIEFYVNPEITYVRLSHFKTKDGKTFFEQGNSKQKELESTLLLADKLRNKYNNSRTAEEKSLIGQEILSTENETYTIKKEAEQLLLQAKNKETEFWASANVAEIEAFHLEISRINQLNKKVLNKKTEIVFDTTVFINPEILLGNNEFASLAEETIEQDLIYKIQIGAYSRGLPNYIQKLFDKLSLLRKIENYTDDRGVVVYTTGNMTNYEDALKMQNHVRQEGAEDAMVVPYFKGKRITLKEAKELEKL